MEILVTGATGFIGKHLVKELVKKHKVRCFAREESKPSDISFLEDCKAEIFIGDIYDKKSLRKAMKGIDSVFHLAGGGYVATTFKKGFEELKKLNVLTTKNVIEASVDSKVKRFVHYSSISAMGIIVNQRLDETSSCKPGTPHEVCKLETEKIMDKYKDKIIITIIRPGIVFGPHGMNSEILQLAKLMKKPFFVIPGNGKNIMPWIYVDEVVKATINIFNKNKKSGERFIVVSEPQPTFNQLIYTIRGAMKEKTAIFHIPKHSFRAAAGVLEKLGDLFGFAPLINSTRARSMTSDRIYSIEKIKNLNHKPMNNFKNSIKMTIDWYKQNGYI